MIAPTLRGKIIENKIPQLTRAVREEVVRIVVETAEETASVAYQLSPVDTGFMRSTIAVEISKGGERAVVVVGADYAIFVEYGTHDSPAQPFLRPAIVFVRKRMNRRLGQFVRGLGNVLNG